MSRFAIHRPKLALLIWLLVIVGLGVFATSLDSKFNDSFSLPGAQSTKAQDLLEKLNAGENNDVSIKVIWSPTQGKVTDEATKKAVEPVLKEISKLNKVNCVSNPYGDNFGAKCASKVNVSAEKALMHTIHKELRKVTGLTNKEIDQASNILAQIAPIAEANGSDLAQVAKALPAIAQLSQLPPDVIAGLRSVDQAVADASTGLTKKQLEEVDQALGGLQEFAKIPSDIRDELAKADPKELAAIAKALPSAVGELNKLEKEFNTEVTTLQDAAKATDAALSPIGPNGEVAFSTVTFDSATLTPAEATRITNTIERANSPALQVGASGAVLEGAGAGGDNSEAIGLLAAIVILLIGFGSVVAAGLPIFVAMIGLVAGQLLVLVVAKFTTVASFAPTLAAMIGLGVGIDYALFITNRYRQGLQDGLAPKEAALKSVGTAGRAVLFAGSTVILALLGMFVLGIQFFNGLAIAAGAAVLMVMISALFMLPALLSLLGTKAFKLRLPWGKDPVTTPDNPKRWRSFAHLIQRKPLIPLILSLVLVGGLAVPALSLQLGFPDDGSQAEGTPLRTGYDLLAEGFGPGVSGPFFVAVETKKENDFEALKETIRALNKTKGVESTLPSIDMLPLVELNKDTFGSGGKITSVLVQPTTSPQDEATGTLLERIRSTTAQEIKKKDGTVILVGGSQAVSTDFTDVLIKVLPLFLLLVVGMGFLALTLLFHSFLIPLTAAITSLLSFGAAMGVTVAVFQWGFADSILGVSGTGPILPFLPVMVFAILFGLSMDYQVFLVSRMKEEWEQSQDNRKAVLDGLAGSGKVVVIAATIMTCVFLSFVPTPNDTIKLFGVALAASVIIDAFIVRLVLVPSIMTLFGKANWWLPKWLDKALPKITLE
ncbi:MAG: MMPL family transporter [Candidatus Nanopelagicales bacterium]